MSVPAGLVRPGRTGSAAAALALAAALVSAALALALVAARGSGPPAGFDDRVREVASSLRCVVCQGLSVADSPSAIAREMRAQIARELRAGRTPDQVRESLVRAYSEWILLSPRRRGTNLVLWLAPVALLLAGLMAAFVALHRWSRTGAGVLSGGDDTEPIRASAEGRRLLDPLTDDDRRRLERALASGEDAE